MTHAEAIVWLAGISRQVAAGQLSRWYADEAVFAEMAEGTHDAATETLYFEFTQRDIPLAVTFAESQEDGHTHGVDDGQVRMWCAAPALTPREVVQAYLQGYHVGDDEDAAQAVVCGRVVAADGRLLAMFEGRPDGVPAMDVR